MSGGIANRQGGRAIALVEDKESASGAIAADTEVRRIVPASFRPDTVGVGVVSRAVGRSEENRIVEVGAPGKEIACRGRADLREHALRCLDRRASSRTACAQPEKDVVECGTGRSVSGKEVETSISANPQPLQNRAICAVSEMLRFR